MQEITLPPFWSYFTIFPLFISHLGLREGRVTKLNDAIFSYSSKWPSKMSKTLLLFSLFLVFSLSVLKIKFGANWICEPFGRHVIVFKCLALPFGSRSPSFWFFFSWMRFFIWIRAQLLRWKLNFSLYFGKNRQKCSCKEWCFVILVLGYILFYMRSYCGKNSLLFFYCLQYIFFKSIFKWIFKTLFYAFSYGELYKP